MMKREEIIPDHIYLGLNGRRYGVICIQGDTVTYKSDTGRIYTLALDRFAIMAVKDLTLEVAE